jgi:hypothetical protein
MFNLAHIRRSIKIMKCLTDLLCQEDLEKTKNEEKDKIK